MKIYKNFKIEKKFQNSAIAIGNFDGFHLGHQKVINQGKLIAKKNNLKFGLLVFQPLPIMFFNKTDLPVPDAPIITIDCPFWISRLRPSKTIFSPNAL